MISLGFVFEALMSLSPWKQLVCAGHNLLLDLFYSYFQFEGNLPSDVRKFKAAITQIFPLIFDTKHIAANDPAFKVSELALLAAIHAVQQETDDSFQGPLNKHCLGECLRRLKGGSEGRAW